MNWKRLFLGSLLFSAILAGIYFSLESATIESLGGWNMAILTCIVGAPSFTFFSWTFKAAGKDRLAARYKDGYLKSVYQSFLNQLSSDPDNKELHISILEAGKKYYASKNEEKWEARIQKDISERTSPSDQAA